MTQIVASLAAIAPQYDALFCDLWGCLHDGVKPFAAAVAALQAYRAQGGVVVLVTNSPRPSPAVIAQLDGMGVPRDAWDSVASSGDAAQFALVNGLVGRRVHLIGAPKDMPFFTTFAPDVAQYAARQPAIEIVPLQEAQGLVCTGLRDDLNEGLEDYHEELLAAKTLGLPMLCANPDIVVDLGEKRLWCAGALARDYEQMGGRALYFGKPHPPIYDLARRRLADLGLAPEARILCVGDGVKTDIQGGLGENLDTLFITGGIDAAAFGPDRDRPDPDLLAAWLNQQQLAATWAIGALR